MSVMVRATIRCDGCGVWIAYDGRSARQGDAVGIARDRYGWTVGREHRCFECRRRPLEFHAYTSPMRYAACDTCDRYDDAAHPRRAVHREAEVRRNAATLARDTFAEWRTGGWRR